MGELDDAIQLSFAIRKAAHKLNFNIDANKLLELDSSGMIDYLKQQFPDKYDLILSEAHHLQRNLKLNFAALPVNNFLENVQLFHEQQPFFYDKNQLFWFWNKELTKWEITDEVDIMNSLEMHF